MTIEEAIQWFEKSPFMHKEHEPFKMAIEALKQQLKAEQAELQIDGFFRNPTVEERKAVADYIDSISVSTGVNIFDLMSEPQICDFCKYYNSNIPCGTTPSVCKKADKFAKEFIDGLKKLKSNDKSTISKMEQVGKEQRMKIGDEVWVHGYVDEIRKDCIIIRNDGGYFGTVAKEIRYYDDIEEDK